MAAPDEVPPSADTGPAGISLAELGFDLPAPAGDVAGAAALETDENAPALPVDEPVTQAPVVSVLTQAELDKRNAWTRRSIDRLIAAIDRMLSAQVDEILHHPKVQRLEASWRGIMWLIRTADGSKWIRIKLLNMTWMELTRDIDRALEFDQSQIFDKVYTQEFDTPGGIPYGLIIADYEPTKHPRDIATLRGLASAVGAAHTSTVLGCSPAVFGVDGFRELVSTIDITALFQRGEFTAWRGFCSSTEDARYLGFVLPRVLMRKPYRNDGYRADGFVYSEATHLRSGRGWLWGSAAYAFGVVVVRSFATYGWFADIRGAGRDLTGGGLVDDMPTPWFTTDRPGVGIRVPVEIQLTERQEKEFSDVGFLPLVPARLTAFAAFHSNQSAWQPPRYDKAAARMNAKLSSMLQQILCVSRFAHYIKVMARDEVGSFRTADECRDKLMKWLQTYTQSNDDASLEIKAKYPLRDADIEVTELVGKPGSFAVVARLQPQFQLDEIGANFNLVSTVRSQNAA